MVAETEQRMGSDFVVRLVITLSLELQVFVLVASRSTQQSSLPVQHSAQYDRSVDLIILRTLAATPKPYQLILLYLTIGDPQFLDYQCLERICFPRTF